MMTSSSGHRELVIASQSPRVVVVGAGFAGVSAAATLKEAGINDVVVLEAQERPGGRVYTHTLDGGFLETGAQFIHGQMGNKLFEIAENYGMLMDMSLYQGNKISDSSAEDYNKGHNFYSSGRELLQRDKTERLLKCINHIFRDYANSFFADSLHDSDNIVDDNGSGVNGCRDYDHARLRTLGTQHLQQERPGNKTGYEDVETADHNITMSSSNSTSSIVSCQLTKKWKKKEHDLIDYSGTTLGDRSKQETTFREVLNTSRQRLLDMDCGVLDTLKLAFLKWMEQWEYTDNGARLEDCSLQAYGKYGYVPGYGLTLSSSGLADIFHTYVHQHLAEDTIQLNKPVKTIFWDLKHSGSGRRDK